LEGSCCRSQILSVDLAIVVAGELKLDNFCIAHVGDEQACLASVGSGVNGNLGWHIPVFNASSNWTQNLANLSAPGGGTNPLPQEDPTTTKQGTSLEQRDTTE
jgi:hypothetical protein